MIMIIMILCFIAWLILNSLLESHFAKKRQYLPALCFYLLYDAWLFSIYAETASKMYFLPTPEGFVPGIITLSIGCCYTLFRISGWIGYYGAYRASLFNIGRYSIFKAIEETSSQNDSFAVKNVYSCWVPRIKIVPYLPAPKYGEYYVYFEIYHSDDFEGGDGYFKINKWSIPFWRFIADCLNRGR